MLRQDWIGRAEAFLKERFDASAYLNAHPQAKAYRIEHSYRVANIGRQIAVQEGFDENEMLLACLLHDISYCEDFGADGWREHGRRAAQIARTFLETLDLPDERIQDICYGIAIHVDDEADFAGERTPFALTVGDADNIDRFDAFRIHEGLCKDRFLDMGQDKKREYVRARLEKLRKLREVSMATKAAEALWQARLSFYAAFFEKLLAQLEASSSIV